MATGSVTGFRPTPIDIEGILDQSLHKGLAMVWHDFFLPLLPSMWPFLIGGFVVIVGGIILQIVMMRIGGYRNRLSSGFNTLVGSLVRLAIFGILVFIAYLIWGVQVVDELWLAIIGTIAFAGTSLFLRKIGFWYR
jgi:hypothetical protein